MKKPKRSPGLTVLELMVALALSGLLISLLYRTFVNQNKTYAVQERVLDMNQSARAAISQVIREVRIAGFGRVAGEFRPVVGYESKILPVQFKGKQGEIISYRNVINRDTPQVGWLTLITAVQAETHRARILYQIPRYELILDRVSSNDQSLFDLENKRYVSLDGVESNEITSIVETTVDGKRAYQVRFRFPIIYNHGDGDYVYPVTAISLQVEGREELGAATQPAAENIESIRFDYFTGRAVNGNPEPAANDRDIRMIRATITARTNMADPDFKEGDGFRRRSISTNINVRNLAFIP